jgi:hypothetical protein
MSCAHNRRRVSCGRMMSYDVCMYVESTTPPRRYVDIYRRDTTVGSDADSTLDL